ncbi:alanine--tRNA ligase [Algoriphagus halophytocola]|uniref:Alanine--tRNA ligase n=1 Tax=Algoriphagus halophytocola TaxID=2991499 RepID=A0ABY6MKJ7_9BACT|nr:MULTISPECIES: alanine--tRNA ligase [unclassified Algoriphagus]UZD23620.1 alanine--tRNA ligase [Algoriphagus sp. TR-M5]WBL44913.1 alanine--tRNA ligase [Algoriphagus sp. TR-M9]
MEAKKIRSTFIEFFQSKQHQYVPSSPIVVKNDPTLMFTNAGMNQFKDAFLGNEIAKFPRVANSQKCLRVSGKHNDLEEVGVDTYHHTMFEMLGNWSFGDYFKKEAITWAWELLTEVYGLDQDRLYVSVFEGDQGDNLGMDQEAYDFWKAIVPEDRIIMGNKKDNFWEMGDVGPCGPCSEIHIDLRPDAERAQIAGKDLVNNDHEQVIEIWNLVFMQFNRVSDGSLKALPATHVDTGMGFERLVRAIQHKSSNYDTDLFAPFLDALAKKSGKVYGKDLPTDIAFRVIVDHIRAISFTIADGQLPSNNKAGYVIRRILRRAVRYGYTFLGFHEPFLYELTSLIADNFGDIFPEVRQQQEFIAKVIFEEETSFLRTLDNGLKMLDQIKAELAEKGENVIPGKTAFELYDTFGFPLDLTSLIARESGLSLDEKGFTREMEEQKSRSRAASESETGDWVVVNEDDGVEFVGYDFLEADSRIIKYRVISDKKGDKYQLVLDKTPFYAESGGQVGDTGILISDTETIKVIDTKKENDLIVHFVEKLPAYPAANFGAEVDAEKRFLTENNHTATHLLQAALKEVLGDHIQQRGSLVNQNLLRFDFSHFSKLTDAEISKVEDIVNEKIRQNIPLVEQRNVPIEEAKKQGATALFGEKYGDFVRVVTFDRDFSVELCGGTHVPQTSQIGLFKIVSEGSSASGVRRIEAVTAEAAERYYREQEELLKKVQEILKNPKDLTKSLEGLIQERNELKKELEELHLEKAGAVKAELLRKFVEGEGMNTLIAQVTLPNADSLKKLAYELKNEVEKAFVILAANISEKPQIAVIIDEELVKNKALNAGQIVRDLAKEIQGGGGGQPFFATAGGKNLAGLENVVAKAKELYL